MINIINSFINNKSNADKRDFCLWKNKNSFLCAEVHSLPEENYYAVSFSFTDDKNNISKIKEMGVADYFRHDFFAFEISKEQAETLTHSNYFIDVKDIKDWDYIKGNYSELLTAPTINKEKGLECLISAVKDYFNSEDLNLSEMYSMEIADIVVETIYHNVDNNFKWGDITGRILFEGEVIGHYNRNGRYMEDYEYYTHDIKKWKKMLSVIEENLKTKREDFRNLNVFSKDDDIYEIARISGSNDEDE